MIRFLLFLALCAIIKESQGDAPHIQFLIRYGYLEAPEERAPPSSFSDEEIDSALKTAQKFAGIPETGKLDNDTLKMLVAPRCGVPDTGSRLERYVKLGTVWHKRNITYGILSDSPEYPRSVFKTIIRQALLKWAIPSGLKFSYETRVGRADIKLGFYEREHGHGDPFDGPGGVVAHAYGPGPGLGGDCHFDSEEEWVLGTGNGGAMQVSFLGTAVHELGHSLGLDHSRDPGSIMVPYYTPQMTLGKDDIRGIKALYRTK